MRAPALRFWVSLGVLACFFATPAQPRARAQARVGRSTLDPVTEKALRLAEEGEKLYLARDYAQALVEYQRAHETKPSPVSLVMMAQCEYYLGFLHEARRHYEAYLADSPRGEMVEVAKDRIESINRRPATLVINSVPDEAEVRIDDDSSEARAQRERPAPAPASAPVPAIIGQSPNSFSVLRGRWRLTVSKANYVTQVRFVEVDVADTKSLFFKLDPIPAHLEVETSPPGATLFINGNRTRNPYRQDLLPGHVEIIAEASDHVSRSLDLDLGPGERSLLTGSHRVEMRYVQRTGRSELLASSALLGGLLGASAVAAKIGDNLGDPGVSTVTFLLGGAVTGGVLGGLITNSLVPAYIPDNRALFLIGAMWIGTLEGAASGIVIQQALSRPVNETSTSSVDFRAKFVESAGELSPFLRSALVGSLPGLVLGTAVGALSIAKAPTYGRVTLIQSSTLGGALMGGLLGESFQWHPFSNSNGHVPLDRTLPTLIGLNAGLAAGLMGAYLPDQSQYGPSWRRVLLVDLGAGAGVVAGMVSGCLSNSNCYNPKGSGSANNGQAGPDARARTAVSGLVGGAVGAAAAWFLTSGSDRNDASSNDGPSVPFTPSVGLLQTPGQTGAVPGAVVFGIF